MNPLLEWIKRIFNWRPRMEDVTLNAQEQEFLRLLNAHRVANSLAPLVPEGHLCAAAVIKAHDMAARDYFSHTSPGPDGTLGTPDDLTPWILIEGVGYIYNTYKGENIAAFYGNAAAAFEGLKSSPGHNANMLGANYKSTGIGQYLGPKGWYWCNNFGGV